MKRYALERLKQWKNSPIRKPLIIEGARQTGKTWLMKEFGRVSYKKTAYITFYKNERIKEAFKQDYDINRLLLVLSAESQTPITKGDTLIILDEIQEAPEALESLKYFCEDANEYHIVAAGSLLGLTLHQNISFPVGKVNFIELYPLNYREFLLAMDQEELVDLLDTKDYEMISIFHDKYLFWLKNYYYVGGMPEVVKIFKNTRDYNAVRQLQNDLLKDYQLDFGKHIVPSEIQRVNQVFHSIPFQLSKENKKFFFGQVKKGARSKDFELAVEWLNNCGLIYKVNRLNVPHYPAAAHIELNAYKLFILDIGLLGALASLDVTSIVEENKIFIEFKGALTEQYVAQQIYSDTEFTPYYFGTKSASFEQDFMIQSKKDMIPIEVKSSTNVQSKSLMSYCEKYNPHHAIKLSQLPYKKNDLIINLPLYAIANIE